jgi:hypothetical protein
MSDRQGDVEHDLLLRPQFDRFESIHPDDLHELVGRTFQTPWFQTEFQARDNYWRGTYLDAVYGGFKDDYLPGMYLLGLLEALTNSLFRVEPPFPELLNYGFNRVRFTAMVYPRDVLRLICTVDSVEQRSSGQLMRMDCRLVSQLGELTCIAEWLVLVPTLDA